MAVDIEIPRVTVQCRILTDLFNEGPLTLSELVADTAETFEAYKTAWYMCRQGWIVKEGFHYKLTPYGISMIAAGAEDSCGGTDRRAVGMASTSPRLTTEHGSLPSGARCGNACELTPNSQSIGLKPLSTRGSDGGNASPAGIVCAQEGETALDSMAGRVQVVKMSYLCEGPDCNKIITTTGLPPRCGMCADRPVLCGHCMDEHMEAGHVSDGENVRSAKF